MIWENLVNKNINIIAEHLNDLLQEKDMDHVSRNLKTNKRKIISFLEDNGYIYIESKKEFKESTMSQYLREENKNFTNEEMRVLKSLASLYADKKSSLIKINLPDPSVKQTSVRVNETVWKEFKLFCNNIKQYDNHELVSMALIEYMNKYND